MSILSKTVETFTILFVDDGPKVRLELVNESEHTLKSVEILTIFLKDEEAPGSPSRIHISFATLDSIRPKERAVVSHRTWIDGKPATPETDQLKRLKEMAGENRPYTLNLSWEDAYGKTRFQRMTVGH